jgi:pimeloyl-[acyl-carrier protein] methyl ester esterase
VKAIEEGASRRPPLVLLHGFGLHSGLWGDWPRELAAHSEPQPIDLPGHGGRHWDDGIRDLAGLARAVADEVPPGAIVLGWSLGGMVALELARRRPSTLRGLVLVATTPCFVTARGWPHGIESEVVESFARDLRADYRRALREFVTLQVLGAADPRATLRALRDGIGSRPAPAAAALATGVDILRRSDLRAALPSIELETLVIAGLRDRLTPPAACRLLAAALPRARLLEIDGAGHAPFLSHAALLRDAVSQFLDGLRPSPAGAVATAG